MTITNPTQKEIEEFLRRVENAPNPCTSWDNEEIARLVRLAQQGLNMQEEIQRILDGHIGNGMAIVDGKKGWVAGMVYAVVKKFSEGGDG